MCVHRVHSGIVDIFFSKDMCCTLLYEDSLCTGARISVVIVMTLHGRLVARGIHNH